jgi:hypothetical protein
MFSEGTFKLLFLPQHRAGCLIVPVDGDHNDLCCCPIFLLGYFYSSVQSKICGNHHCLFLNWWFIITFFTLGRSSFICSEHLDDLVTWCKLCCFELNRDVEGDLIDSIAILCLATTLLSHTCLCICFVHLSECESCHHNLFMYYASFTAETCAKYRSKLTSLNSVCFLREPSNFCFFHNTELDVLLFL